MSVIVMFGHIIKFVFFGWLVIFLVLSLLGNGKKFFYASLAVVSIFVIETFFLSRFLWRRHRIAFMTAIATLTTILLVMIIVVK
jgi:hypothetical protein